MIISIMIIMTSLHRHDNGNFYPGTGGSTECGANVGLGTNINIAWSGKHWMMMMMLKSMMMMVKVITTLRRIGTSNGRRRVLGRLSHNCLACCQVDISSSSPSSPSSSSSSSLLPGGYIIIVFSIYNIPSSMMIRHCRDFAPDMVLVSAGFDAGVGHEHPIGGYKVSDHCGDGGGLS